METPRSGTGSLNSAQYCMWNGLNFKDRFLRLDIRSAGHVVFKVWMIPKLENYEY